MERFELSASERSDTSQLLNSALAAGVGQSEDAFIRAGALFAHELPRSVRQALRTFALDDDAPALMLTNNPFFDSTIGPTPPGHRLDRHSQLSRPELLAGLYTSLLGECIGYSSQQGGRIFNNILAVASQAHVANSSAGSDQTFDLHTEDAFHPCPPDYLSLSCLRNAERAVTTLAWLPPGSVGNDAIALLMREPLTMIPNAMHRDGGAHLAGRFPIFSGTAHNPYLRLNLNTLDLSLNDAPPAVRDAIGEVVSVLRNHSFPIVLEPGDYLLLNNRRCLHGREPYPPLYSGDSRWLIRVAAVSDIRQTRHLRGSAADRSIGLPA